MPGESVREAADRKRMSGLWRRFGRCIEAAERRTAAPECTRCCGAAERESAGGEWNG
jgi:hypothetical protein